MGEEPVKDRGRRFGDALVLAVVALLLLGGAGLAVQHFSGDLMNDLAEAEAGQSDAECVTVTLAAAPEILDPMLQGADALQGTGACRPLEVIPGGIDEVSRQAAGSRNLLWAPQASFQIAQAGDLPLTTLSESIASTPLLLEAASEATKRPSSWRKAVEGGRVALRSPATEGGSAAVILVAAADGDLAELRGVVADAAKDPDAQETKPLSVTTEAGLASGVRVGVDVTPGAHPVLDFPLVVVGQERSSAAERGRELLDWLRTEDGRAAVAAAHLRPADGTPLGDGAGLGEIEVRAVPAEAAGLDLLAGWDSLGLPASVLAVLDASGSMKERDGGVRRAEVVHDGTRGMLDALVKRSRVGLWTFSTGPDHVGGGAGNGWEELAPLRTLSKKSGARGHADRLGAALDAYPATVGGGTSLYATTLAAYRAAQAAHDPYFDNSVLLVSDGTNDDPGSLSLDELLKKLAAAADPERPVRIVAVGTGPDADMDVLRRIAEATGGSAARADNAEDLTRIALEGVIRR